MEPTTVGLLLAAALLHASWNALLRGGGDRFATITVMTTTGGVVALPVALALPAPSPASWPFLAASTALQVAYCLALVRAYSRGELGQVYPIARGSSPLLVVVGAALVAGERPGALALAGIGLVSVGILGLALDKLDRRALFAALVTGALIAAYTVVDGLGARASTMAPSYAAWLFVCHGAAMLLLYAATRGRPRVDVRAAAGGVLSIGAYGIVVWALSISPMGSTSALRETSVLFAALIGRAFLQERLGPARVASCVAIAAGVVMLAR